MGSLFGGGDAKKAAKIQADATTAAAKAQAEQANYAAMASAQQQSLATEQRAAQQKANDLLSTPMESATVDLAADEGDDNADLLKRKKTTRQTYQRERTSGLSI